MTCRPLRRHLRGLPGDPRRVQRIHHERQDPIILRGTQAAFSWSLFDAGYTFASQIASAASEFNDQYKAGAYIAAGLVLFILTFVVNSLARAAVAGKASK